MVAGKYSPSQVIEEPIDRQCCLTLPDSKDITDGIFNKSRIKSNMRTGFWQSSKFIFIVGIVISILIILSSLKFMCYIVIPFNSLYNTTDLSYAETHMDRGIKKYYPHGKELFSESQAGQVDEVASINDHIARIRRAIRNIDDNASTRNLNDARFKRDSSRNRRDCSLNATYCKQLLQSIQNYLEIFANKHSTTSQQIITELEDAVMCLKCKKQSSIIAKEYLSPLNTKERYLMHDYVNQDHSNDSDITVIKLLDNKGNNDESSVHKNSTENSGINEGATKIQLLETNSMMNNASDNIVIIPIDHMNFNRSLDMHVNTSSSDNGNLIDDNNQTNANDPQITFQTQNDKYSSSPAIVDVEPTATTEDIENNVTALRFTTMSSDTETTWDDNTTPELITSNFQVESTEMNEGDSSVNLTEQIVITENATTKATYNVSGVSRVATNPSVYPSFEGHPEDQSFAVANDSRTTNDSQTKNNGESNGNLEQFRESMKSFEQLNPSTSWTIPHPVCFYGYPGQSNNNKPGQNQAYYYPSSSGSSSTQHRPTFQNGFAFGQTANSPLPSYIQVQAQSVQISPRLNYMGSAIPSQQSIQQGVGPTGPATAANIPTFSGNQQTGTSALSSTGGAALSNTPYFCTYISLPILKFPSMTGMPQYNRYSVDKGDNPVEQQKNENQTCEHNTASSKICSSNSQPCVADGHCVPKVKWCDGFVDCHDGSDETMCSCKDRISQNRLCDGYFDCPQAEDESGCFDCPADSFSCHDWERRDNCIPLSQRCDGINQCSNGNDELDCNILSENYLNSQNTFTIGYTQGYLHKNVGGKWYPVCSNALSWAMDACSSEAGQPITTEPEIQAVHLSTNDFQGPYVTEIDGQVNFVNLCPHNALYVRCPPLTCGTTAPKRRDSTPVFDTMKHNIQYLYRSNTDTHVTTSKNVSMHFDRLYQGMINLLHKNYTNVSENDVDHNSSNVVSQQLRVVGGRASEPRAWPFLVAIYKDGIFHCGGVILNKIWILTAAHCLMRSKAHYYEVHAGILRQSSFSPMSQTRKAQYIIVHPAYNGEAMQNDIALIILDKPFYFNRWIRQVCLPSENTAGTEWRQGPPPESTCTAIGWGAVTEHGPDPDHLREVEVPILSSCKYPLDQNNATICAGYTKGGRDACQGDSGGPLMCRNPNLESQWYVAGIISHGEGCARPNEPGSYMKVSYFVQWIKTIIEELSLPHYGIMPLSKCPGFVCQNGKCLSIKQRCDRFVDCLGGEDEMDCLLERDYVHYRQLDANNKSMEFESEMESTEATFDSTMETLSSTETISVTIENQIETLDSKNKDVIHRNVTKMSSELFRVNATFTCTKLLQTIEIEKRCDRHFDCEDGIDEDGCICRDFLSRLQPESICDGHLDCDDETDEAYCDTCQKDEFLCSRSGVCIPIAHKCDSKFDCPLMEDEIDCFTLTDGKYLYTDRNNRPILNTEGFISMNINGKWRVKCYGPTIQSDYMSLVSTQTCNYLGFVNAQTVENVVIRRAELAVRSWRRDNNTTNYESSVNDVVPDEGEETCSALRIRCRPVVNSSAEKYAVVNPTTGNYIHLWPWLAAIFIDGHYRCMVLLLKPDWLLSYSRCTQNVSLSVNYTVAVLGHSRSYLYVDGPHEQISLIDEIRYVNNSNVTLLHLKYTVNITNYVQPLFLERQTYPPDVNDTCVSIGTDEEYETNIQIVKPVLENCHKCDRCYENNQYRLCSYRSNSTWDGTVFCLNNYGWYPAAVFQEDGLCNTFQVRNMTSIDYINAYLDQATAEKRQPIAEPVCDGVRCKLGQCISWDKVCDGVSNCRAGEDEKPEICDRKQEFCNNTNCEICSKQELRCGNGECISKSSFCDGKVDCSDGTDEPVECTCAEYLKLTAPERLCDGVRHCFDKTDESPEMCACTANSYKCDSDNSTCIPYDFVCDGEEDCSSGMDEINCTKIQPYSSDKPNMGEVMQQSYGVWHSYCLSVPKITMTEASDVCIMNGYSSGESVYQNIMKRIPLVPSRDDFYIIRVNSETWITLRHDKPLITLVRSQEPCYGFYVNCN